MKLLKHLVILSGALFSTLNAYTIHRTYNDTSFPFERKRDGQPSLYYYYDQLRSYEKVIYDSLRQQIETGLINGHPLYDFNIYDIELYSDSDASTAGFRATSAFVMDNPKYFWIGRGSQQSITTLDNVIKELAISFKRSYEEEELIGMLNQINDNISDLVNEVNGLATTCEKLQRIHDYLVKMIKYQYGEEYSRYNIYGALVEHASVCEGYAEAFTYICQLVGIPTIIVNSDTHEWNLVYMEDGQWYAMDVTYDDPKINSMEFKSGDDRNKKYDYFLIGKTSRITNGNAHMMYQDSAEHQILDYLLVESSRGFTFPEIAETAYECTSIKKSTNYILQDFYLPNKKLYLYILIGIAALFIFAVLVICIRGQSSDSKRRRAERTPVFVGA